jgi:hypothetical protein
MALATPSGGGQKLSAVGYRYGVAVKPSVLPLAST